MVRCNPRSSNGTVQVICAIFRFEAQAFSAQLRSAEVLPQSWPNVSETRKAGCLQSGVSR